MTPKGSKKLKDMLNERERHTIVHRIKKDVDISQISYKHWSVSRDGLFQTDICQACGVAVTVPVVSQ